MALELGLEAGIWLGLGLNGVTAEPFAGTGLRIGAGLGVGLGIGVELKVRIGLGPVFGGMEIALGTGGRLGSEVGLGAEGEAELSDDG